MHSRLISFSEVLLKDIWLAFEVRKLRFLALCRDSHEDSKLSKKLEKNIFNENFQKNNEDVVLEL